MLDCRVHFAEKEIASSQKALLAMTINKEDKMAEDKLPTRAQDFAEWYNQLVIRADLADYAPVRGCMVVKPYGWALWENITSWLDAEFKKTGHVNAAFPTLIPLSFFEKEKEHVEVSHLNWPSSHTAEVKSLKRNL